MSYVVASPEYVAAAASDLAGIGSALSTANAAAAAPTIEVLAAGADEVSAAIAAFFGAHAQAYQALSEQASAFHLQFVQAMTAGAGAYAGAEAVNASPLQAVLDVLNAPAQALFGRPLIGDGAGGAPGQSGGDGGLLYGNGGNGGNGGVGQAGRAVAAGRSGATRAAVAVQDAAVAPVCPGSRGRIGAVADQRASQQRLGGRIDRVEQDLLDAGGLGARIRRRTGGDGAHELVVKGLDLHAERLVVPRVGAEK